jgi:pilus assembly protein CpaD
MLRPSLLTAPLLLVAVAACSVPAGGPTFSPAPVTPTERFALEAAPTIDEIALAPRVDGLSAAQRDALASLTARYRAGGGSVVVVQAPQGAAENPALKTAHAAKAELEALGLDPAEVRLVSHAPDGARPLVRVGFETVAAVVHDCGRTWGNLTATKDNKGFENFGCAVTSNMAAQIADPRDIYGRRPLDPADAGRRQVVLGKYRLGERTSSQDDERARGVVSDAVE